ncbi:hypothetical protein GGS21DRAFT_487326 [Xylaria nigripes]|nr:hypothetical protein GGS21DRAFT_487326 [Xylaria nigripes]
MPETLREKASKKLKGPDANPSQLGDPISMKAETSDTVPTEEEGGAAQSSEGETPKPDNAAPKSDDGEKTLRKEKVVKRDPKLNFQSSYTVARKFDHCQ